MQNDHKISKTHTIILKPWEAGAFTDGSKTSLLRLVEPQPSNDAGCWFMYYPEPPGHEWLYSWKGDKAPNVVCCKAPYQVGDTLVCKETWGVLDANGNLTDSKWREYINYDTETKEVSFRSSPIALKVSCGKKGPWRSPVTMPRWAVRTVRKVVGVQCLRVQDITEEQALADSVKTMYQVWEQNHTGPLTVAFNPRVIWSYQLEQDYPGAWERNDWAWLYDLEVV